MIYGATAHNRSVYASPLLGNRRRDVARYVSTINPDGTLGEIRAKLVGKYLKILDKSNKIIL
jgi:hypothetical protein